MRTIKKILCSVLILLPQATQPSAAVTFAAFQPQVAAKNLSVIIATLQASPTFINQKDSQSHTPLVWTAALGYYQGFVTMLQMTLSIITPPADLSYWVGQGSNAQIKNLFALITSTPSPDYSLLMQYISYLSSHPTIMPVATSSLIPTTLFSATQQTSTYIPRGDLADFAEGANINSAYGIPLLRADKTGRNNTNIIQYGASPKSYSLGSAQLNTQDLISGIYMILHTPNSTGIRYSLYDKNGKALSKNSQNYLTATPITEAGPLVTNSPIGYMFEGSNIPNANQPLPNLTFPSLFFLQHSSNGTVIFPTATKKKPVSQKLASMITQLTNDITISTATSSALLGANPGAAFAAFPSFQSYENIIADLYKVIQIADPTLAKQLPTLPSTFVWKAV